MTEMAAYYLAESKAFIGHAGDYWAAAEAQIAKLFNGKK